MASTYTATGTISNLTRVELEQLRRADFFSNGKALTIGDSALSPEGVVGKGDVNAEPYLTLPSARLDDVYSNTLPDRPGPGLATLSTVGAVISETVRWYGPTPTFDGIAGYAVNGTQWRDDTIGLNFTLFVQPNDILLIKPNSGAGDANTNVVATVSVVAANTLTLTNIVNPSLPGTTLDFGGADLFSYVVVRPTAVQLFAVPGSGPAGEEQTFLMVSPASTLHSNLSPTLNQINTDRITNIVPSTYAVDTTVDRADAVFNPPAVTRVGLNQLGYRVILYPDNGTGTVPDLSTPISALNPVIDPAIPANEQRMTFDFKAGIVRFSVAPKIGGDIKKAGGVNPTTGRLSLYAVFWAVDTNITAGSARYLHATRSTEEEAKAPGEVVFDTALNVWKIGSTVDNNEFVVSALSNVEAPGLGTRFGALDLVDPGSDPKRYFAYRSTLSAKEQALWARKGWTMRSIEPNSYDAAANSEVRVGDKHAITVGDGTAPPQGLGDINPTPAAATGYRLTADALEEALVAASTSGYGVVHARKGRYYTNRTIIVPPGVEVRGEGASTVFMPSGFTIGSTALPIFKFGPNTNHGVYDFGYTGSGYSPHTFAWSGTLEGFDIVWNPTRRVWGIAQADPTTNEIWFNEVNLAGVAKYPGVGIAVKGSVNALFTSASLNSSNHTPGHYPRIAHHYPTDEYVFVWVEEYNPGTLGPQVACRILVFDPTLDTHVPKFNTVYPAAGSTYKDHPCVAVDTLQQSTIYNVAIGYWGYNAALTTSQRVNVVLTAFDGSTLASATGTFASQTVVSSNDVAGDGVGNFCYVNSRRAHPILYRTTGATTAGNPDLDDAGANFTTLGVVLGTRYIHLPNGTADNGRSGVVVAIASPTKLVIRFDDVHNEEFKATDPTVTYALAPPSQANSIFYDAATFSFTAISRLAGALALSPNDYSITEREPDFVRISHGEGQYLVAYQTFDTNGYLSRDTIKNFDNSIDVGYLDQGFGVCRSPVAHRQHIATCYCLLDYRGALIGPTVTPPQFDPTFEFAFASQAATVVTRRSLGGRSLNIPYPNLMSGWGLPGFNNESRLEMEVSARNYSYPWSATKAPSLIPAVTWTGSDWLVASPSVARIASDTGTYIVSGFPYLADPTFYFGLNNSEAVQGWHLQQTVTPGDQLFFPALGVTRTILGVNSEHVVQLDSTLAVAPGTSNISWVLVRGGNHSTPPLGGIKNPGYRVSASGEVVVAGEFYTFADPPVEGTPAGRNQPRVTETLNRDLWGDANPVGDLLTGTLPKYGSSFISWNDTITTSKIAADVTFRSVGVGAPKGCNGAFPDEPPMVALAWAENFYGVLDRHVAGTSTNETAFFRQSFGPWNAGLKDLSLVGGSPVASASQPSGLKVLTKEHVFTRHGYHMSGQPYFATDGYRNMFGYVAMQHTTSSYPFGGGAVIGDLDEEGAYYKNINSVYTDAIGRDPIIFRGPPLGIWDSPRELIDTLGALGGAVDIHGSGIRKVNPAAPKVLWNGKRFIAFLPTVYTAPVPLGAWPNSQPTPTNAPNGGSWPRYRATIHMVAFAGDETLDTVNEALQGNVEQLLGSLTANIAANSPKLVANTVVSVGGAIDFEQRDMVVIGAAYSGRVYCVVWSMGYNVVGTPGATRLGGSTIGFTLFPDTDGNSDLLHSAAAQAIQSFVIYSDDALLPGDRWTEKARMINPHVVWDGKHFMIAFDYLDDNLGAGPGGRTLRAYKVGEEGPGGKQHLKALSANTSVASSNQQYGIRKNSLVEFLGLWQSFSGTIAVRGLGGDTPFTSIQAMPGDILQITGITSPTGTSVADTSRNGFYPITDTIAAPGGFGFIDIGTHLPVAQDSRIHGAIYSGGFGGDVLEAPDGSWGAGFNTRSTLLWNPQVLLSTTLTLGPYVNRLFGLAYNENRQEYVLLTECEVAGSGDRRLRLFMVKQSTMTVEKEIDVTTPGTSYLPAALGWNGDKYIVVYGLDAVSPSAQVLLFTVVSQDLVIEQSGTVADYGDAVWTSGSPSKSMPGPGYGLVDTSINMVPMLTACHVEWNGKLNRWVISASYVSQIQGGPTDYYTQNYREKRIANRAGVDFVSWSGRTITTSSATGFRQRGARCIISRENTISSGLTASRYGGDPVVDQNDDSSIYDFGILIASGLVVAPGDQVQVNIVHQKPRLINFVAQATTDNFIFCGGDLKVAATGTVPTLGDTYSLEERGRSRITLVNTGTVNPNGSGTSFNQMRSTTPVNFTATGVKAGHEIIMQSGAASPFLTARARIINISTTTNPNDTLTFDPPITFIDGAAYIIRKQSNIYANIRTTAGAVLTMDVSFAELDDPSLFHLTKDKIYVLPREDVFVWTLGYNTAAVQVHDADGVYLENVDIGGHQDIEERMYHMSRPVRRRGGPVFGEPDDGLVNSRAPTDYLLLRPTGKVSTLRLTNVRSRARSRYGDRGTFRSKP